MTAEAVVHVAQAIDVEGDDDRTRSGTERVLQEVIEAFAEQRALRETRQRIEIRQQLEGVFLLPELERERDVGRDLLQEADLFFLNEIALARAQRERADARAIDDERQRHHRSITPPQQLDAIRDRRLGLFEVVGDGDLARAQRAADEARVRLQAVADRKFHRRLLVDVAAGPVPGDDVATIGRHHADDGVVVAADRHSQAAGLAQQGIPISNANDGRVDATLHLQEASETTDALLLMLALGDVAMGAAEAGHRAIAADEGEQVAFEPAVLAVLVAPARHDAGGRAAIGVEARERIGEGRAVLFVDVVAEVRAVQIVWRQAHHAAHGFAAEHVAATGRQLPDPVLSGVDDVAQALFALADAQLREPPAPTLGDFAERAANRRSQARGIGLEHVVHGAPAQRFDGALFADGAGEKMKGTSGADSSAMSSAASPSNCGMVKSERIRCGRKSDNALRNAGSVSTRW